MTNKKFFTLLITAFAVVGLASVAFGANNVTMTSDKPNIPYSECEQGGAITLSMDDGTAIHEGDVITLTLSNNVTACGNIDLYLELADDGETELGNDPNDPVTSTDGLGDIIDVVFQGVDIANAAPITDGVDEYDIGFRVQATDGSRFIKLTLMKRYQSAIGVGAIMDLVTSNPLDDTYITFVADDPADKLIMKLFDQKTNMFWEEGNPDLANIFDDPITDFPGDESDNVLCIDTVTDNFTGDYVYAVPSSSPTSNPYQLTFFGDYIIAQMVAAVTYGSAESCKDEICRYVPIESGLDQEGDVIPADGVFDFGSYVAGPCADPTQDRWVSVGYCDLLESNDSDIYGNGILFSKTGDTFVSGDEFRVTMTVRVGSAADPDEAVFLAPIGATRSWWTTSNEYGNCSCSYDDISPQLTGQGFLFVPGSDFTSMAADFTVTAVEEIYGAILFDLPPIAVDIDNVAAGQMVYVDVTVEKLPCGIISSDTICLAELIATCPDFAGAVTIDGIAFIGDRQLTNVLHGYLGRIPGTVIGSTLSYPYVPAINDPDFFTGLVVNNMTGPDATITITITDQAGGSASYTTTLGAGLQFVNTLDAIEGDLVDGTTPLNRDLSGYVNASAVAAP